MKLLLENQADPNACDSKGYTALVWAAKLGQFGCLEMLVQHGADINMYDEEGTSALISAVSDGERSFECVKLLLENHADPNIFDSKGYTALMWATKRGLFDCLEILERHVLMSMLIVNMDLQVLFLLS